MTTETKPRIPSIGLVLPGGPGPVNDWPNAGRWFADLESSGCGAIWFTDHLFFRRETPEVLTIAAVAAANTSTCFIGTGVLQLSMRQVAAAAKAAATVSAIAPDRFILGVGLGEHREEYELAGAEFDRRGLALDTAIERLRLLWAPESDEWFAQRPAPGHLPIWVGGRSDASMLRSARLADGWIPMFMSARGYKSRVSRLAEELSRVGRDNSDVTKAVVVVLSVDQTGWSGEAAHRWAASVFRAPEDSLDHHIITGTVQYCTDRLNEYYAAGAEHIAVFVAAEDPRPTFESICLALDFGHSGAISSVHL